MRGKSIIFSLIIAFAAMFVLAGCNQSDGEQSNGENEQGEQEKAIEFDEDITVYVPFKVGGALDTRARVVAKYLEQDLDVTVTVENPTGAGGVVGTTEFLTKNGGPYDLIFSGVTILTLNPLMSDVPYNPDDITPVISNDKEVFGLYTNPDASGISTFEELVAYGKENQIKFGSGGPGNITHMVQKALYKDLGMDAETVPHNGANEGLTNALGGHVDVTLAGVALAKGFVEEGKLTAIAQYGSEEYTNYEGVDPVPTVAEVGHEDYVYESLMFFGMRSSTDAAVVQAMHDAIAKIYDNPDAVADLENLGVDNIVEMNTEEINSWVADEKVFMEKLVDLTK
ncbi:tripartite tricarboxylate transporter substrate binding protein [Radiobacillus sp. PE A8.2]|uniref:tripartite tricarboxylate transporter substrate binding protein n=1 Tax=Radiobacillus sp. PE A8.2 TaxID=3380349 RepID=UPI0038901CDD